MQTEGCATVPPIAGGIEQLWAGHPEWSDAEPANVDHVLADSESQDGLGIGESQPKSPFGSASDHDDALAGWLSAAAEGDGDSFARFYDATIANARIQACRLLRAADVEDVLSDAFFEAWRNASCFDAARGSAVAWMMCIVRSRSLDRLRRNRTHPSVGNVGEQWVLEHVDPSPGPLERALQAQQNTHVRMEIARLSGTERWLVGLAYIRDLSHSEIASSTGLPLGTVKSHLRRLLRKVRDAVAPAQAGSAASDLSPPNARTVRTR